MSIRHVIEAKPRQDVVTIQAGSTMREAVDLLVRENIGALVVLDGEQPVGIVSERDVLRQVARQGAVFLDFPVSEVMTRDIVIARADQEVEDAMYTMTQKRIRHLPVMQDGQLVGMISIGDVVRTQCSLAETEVHYLRDYINGSYH